MNRKTFIVGLLIFTLLNMSFLGFFLIKINQKEEHSSGGAEAATKAQIQNIANVPQEENKEEVEEELLFPIKGEYWETSPFGLRISPFTKKTAVHYGIDLGAPEGTEVIAVKEGIIVTHWPAPDGYYKGHPIYGGFVEILHNDGISRYAHLSKTGNFKEGD